MDVGKAEQLKKRLGEHRFKISGRRNIEAPEMGYKCLFIHRNWTALAPEDSLIRHYRAAGEGECAWNGNGFGPHNLAGIERPRTSIPRDLIRSTRFAKTGYAIGSKPALTMHLHCSRALKAAFRTCFGLRPPRKSRQSHTLTTKTRLSPSHGIAWPQRSRSA